MGIEGYKFVRTYAAYAHMCLLTTLSLIKMFKCFFMNYVCSFHPSDACTHLLDPFLREISDIPKSEKYVNGCYSFTNYTPKCLII